MAHPTSGDTSPPQFDDKGVRPYNESAVLDDGMSGETDLSFASIMKGTAHAKLTTFERKAALINLEIDKFGLGRYQICIWFLCGFGYFLDLAWAQGVGLCASAIYQEMNVPAAATGNIYACANAGLAIGALMWGLLVDVVGRRWSFNLTCLITSIFGLLLVLYSALPHSLRPPSVSTTNTSVRLLLSSTMAPSVPSTSWLLLALAVTSPSTP